MTIEEIRQKKNELEETISRAIAEFEDATTVQISDINYDRTPYLGLHCRQKVAHSVNIQVII